MSNVELLQLSLEASQLTLPLLVEVHLGGSVGASLLQTGGDVLDVLLRHGAALLSLGAVPPLHCQLLVQLLQPRHQLLGLLGVLGAQSGLVINLSGEGAAFLVLSSSSARQLTLHTLQVSYSLLGQLQVTLNLPLALLHISLDLLLTLGSILSLVQRLLQLALDTGQMVALVLGSLDILLSLLPTVGTAS